MDDWAEEVSKQVLEEIEDLKWETDEFSIEKGPESALKIPFHIGLGVGAGILCLTAVGIWTRQKLKNRKKAETKQRFFCRNWGLLFNQQMPPNMPATSSFVDFLKLDDLETATGRFSKNHAIGKGAFSMVYKGTLPDGRVVAVKKSHLVSEVVNEVLMLSKIHHRNIVKMLGCCLESDVPMIVYEYVSNGTLFDHVHDARKSVNLLWEDRLRILKDIAGVVAYLHSCASTSAIYHRELKSRNILLDENYRAVLSGFGISMAVPFGQTQMTTSGARACGYLDPEYIRTGKLTATCDVYSFGVVMAEVLTGERVWFWGMANLFCSALESGCLTDILWKVPASDEQMDQILTVAKLVNKCVQPNVVARPNMNEIANTLRGLLS